VAIAVNFAEVLPARPRHAISVYGGAIAGFDFVQ